MVAKVAFTLLLLSSSLQLRCALALRTISAGISETRLTSVEQVLLNHSLTPPAMSAALTYLWATGEPAVATCVFRLYVDGGAPIEFEIAKFSGTGFQPAGDAAPWQSEFFGSLGRDSWFSTIRVPYEHSLVVTYQQAPGAPSAMFFAQARAVEGLTLDGIIAGVVLPPSARLQVQVREAVAYSPLDYMTLIDLPPGASGALLGTTLWWNTESPNTIEGCVRAFIPQGASFNDSMLLATGWEDYYASSWGMVAGPWQGPWSGRTYYNESAAHRNLQVSAYRLHTADPLFFSDGLRLVLRNGETRDAEGIKCRQETGGSPVGMPGATNLSVVAWAYIW